MSDKETKKLSYDNHVDSEQETPQLQNLAGVRSSSRAVRRRVRVLGLGCGR